MENEGSVEGLVEAQNAPCWPYQGPYQKGHPILLHTPGWPQAPLGWHPGLQEVSI